MATCGFGTADGGVSARLQPAIARLRARCPAAVPTWRSIPPQTSRPPHRTPADPARGHSATRGRCERSIRASARKATSVRQSPTEAAFSHSADYRARRPAGVREGAAAIHDEGGVGFEVSAVDGRGQVGIRVEEGGQADGGHQTGEAGTEAKVRVVAEREVFAVSAGVSFLITSARVTDHARTPPGCSSAAEWPPHSKSVQRASVGKSRAAKPPIGQDGVAREDRGRYGGRRVLAGGKGHVPRGALVVEVQGLAMVVVGRQIEAVSRMGVALVARLSWELRQYPVSSFR